MITNNYQIECDVSLLLPETPNIVPHELCFVNNARLVRIPYFWEDDIEMMKANSCFSIKCLRKWTNPGLKILNFHPIHIYLNSNGISNYEELKKNIPFNTMNSDDISPYLFNGIGTGSFFGNLVSFLSHRPTYKIYELSEMWKTYRWS